MARGSSRTRTRAESVLNFTDNPLAHRLLCHTTNGRFNVATKGQRHMGWSDKAKASGGSTEGVITDYSFMDTFPFGDGEKDDDNDNIYMLLEVTPDGADEP